ncbi:MAG TPA: LutB/LldF family L-lactate oxidation iron-sulfur protein [Terriglobales bacterium]|nr:LutB/LldF family L-lactate oxidation iron-sulfur protein [Terriglobales bacterium]
MSTAAQEFLRKAAEKSADLVHRGIVRWNIDQYDTGVGRGKTRFADWDAARQRCHDIKWEAVNHLDRYLLQFEQKVKENGGHVFWAENGEEARKYICDVAARTGVKKVVKSKSMVSEEIHLAQAMEKMGIEVVETDLGEFIVQLRNEPPYHIVTPAMHLNRKQVSDLFKEKLGAAETQDPPELVAIARRWLRKSFFSAEMGISGANFLIADAGMVTITTNEGNGRLSTSVPRIQVALTGIEKVIPRLQDLATLWPTLATTGTGQPITCYNTLMGGPRRAGEVDGPEEFHVVLVDNGRSELLADIEQREILHCIRCGACINACPVFRNIGGHAYGVTYPGPIGSVLEPHLRGLKEYQHLSFASSLCGACTDVCPVHIELHHHLLHNRRNAIHEGTHSASERLGMKMFRWTMMDAGRFSFFGSLGRTALRMIHGMGLAGTALDPMRPWTKDRAAPAMPRESFRDLWRKQNGVH